MKDYVNEYLRDTLRWIDTHSGHWQEVRPRIRCADGLELSVQASSTHYCYPRADGLAEYYQVEVGFPDRVLYALLPYAEDPENLTETVYGWVPVEVVNEIIEQHGGLADEMPEMW